MLTLTLLLSLTTQAQAALPRIQPELNDKACFAREYSASHMRANPLQHVSKMHVLLERKKDRYGADGTFTAVKVVGEKDGVLFGNEASCEVKENGRVFCFIECDGGSFSLKHGRRGRVNFEVTKDYYFPLYRKGAGSEEEGRPGPEDTLDFRADRANGLYSLERKEAGVCERRWKQYKEADYGC
jgi:hypothetical protein